MDIFKAADQILLFCELRISLSFMNGKWDLTASISKEPRTTIGLFNSSVLLLQVSSVEVLSPIFGTQRGTAQRGTKQVITFACP